MRSLLLLLATACSATFDGGEDGLATDSGADGGADTSADTADAEVDALVTGWVIDAHGLALAGARVHNGATYVVADDEGRFEISLPAEGGTLSAYATTGGGASCARTWGSARRAILGAYATGLPEAVDIEAGATLTRGKAQLAIPALALGTVGMARARFDVVDIENLGMSAAPAGVLGADGSVTAVYAAADIAFEGVDGELAPSVAVAVKLPLAVDNPGGAATVFVAQDCGWSAVGTATISASGTDSVASFEVTAGGSYAVGVQDSGGCVTGQVVDGDGAAVEGATVRAYLRPVSQGIGTWISDTESAADGRFYLPASSLGVEILAEAPDGTALRMGTASGYGSGDGRYLEECNDIGNVALASAGCVMGNLYALDGSRPGPTPFRYQIGDPTWSDTDAEILFWAPPGVDLELHGPGGMVKPFSATSGSTPEADNCARLGNLQLATQCVMADVTDAAGASVASAGIAGGTYDVVTGPDGMACVDSPDGDLSLIATVMRGAQAVSASASVDVEAQGGSCYGGTCLEGPSLQVGGTGCAAGVVYDEDGNPAAGVRVASSSWDTTATDADGTFTLATGGEGSAAVWADGYPMQSFDDPGSDGTCADVTLFMDAGNPPDVVIGDDETLWYLSGDGDIDTLLEVDDGWQSDLTTMDVSPEAEIQVSVHYSTLAFVSDLYGDDFDSFVSGLWSSARVSPDGSMVALQGYGAANPVISLYDVEGNKLRDISSSAGTEPDGLSWSADSLWVASTRKDNAIEVSPASGARAATTIADGDCAYPVFWDSDTVAVSCDGAIRLAAIDGSGLLDWYDLAGIDDRVWAVTGSDRVVYSSGDELHVAYIDGTGDATLHVGNPGTTYRSVRVDGDGRWIVAIVDDPVEGTDVVAFVDQPPYVANWLTDTPNTVELAVDFAE